MIIEHEQSGNFRAEYGKEIIKNLSKELQSEFGRGFSERNLENMRRFFIECKHVFNIPSNNERIDSGDEENRSIDSLRLEVIPQRLSAENNLPSILSWSHYVFLMTIDDQEERKFYEIESLINSWSLKELKRQFGSSLYERLALSREKEEIRDMSRKGQILEKPEDMLKEPYVLEFLGLKEENAYSESDLESAIIDKLEHFLLELGKGFLFEARQKRFTFDSDHFYVDLVFYNRILRCYVLIDLKIDKLTHQDLGQMQMYVNYFDRYVKMEDEKPTIGVILCKTKSDALVRLTLPEDTKVYPRKYQLFIPSKELLKRKLLEWAEEKVVEDQNN